MKIECVRQRMPDEIGGIDFSYIPVTVLGKKSPPDVLDTLGGVNSVACWECGLGPMCGQCPLRSPIEDTLASGAPHEGIAWAPQRASGQEHQRCLLVSTIAVTVEGVRKVVVSTQDITDRKQIEATRSRGHADIESQAALINLSRDAIITCDTNWVISGWNHGAEVLYGWTETEAIGKVLHVLLRTKSFSTAGFDRSLQNRNHWEGELEHRHRNDEPILVESRQVALRNADGLTSACCRSTGISPPVEALKRLSHGQ